MNTHFHCIYFVCFVLEISCELVVGTFNFVDFVHFVPRKSKGEIKQDLMYEYENLGRPGKGKSVHDVIREVEQEQSKNLQFRVEKKQGSIMWLHCGKESRELPQEKPPWKTEVFLEPTTQIPFLSNGKKSVRCICFFQESEGPIVSNQETGPDILTVPLPGKKHKKGPGSSMSMASERGTTGPNTMNVFCFFKSII